MKKVTIIISALLLTTMYSCKKTNSSAVAADDQNPTSISYADANSFISMQLVTYQTQEKFNANQYHSTADLFSNLNEDPNQLRGSGNLNTLSKNDLNIIANMDYVFKKGFSNLSSLPINNLSIQVSSITTNFLHDMSLTNNSNDLSTLFTTYQSKIATNNQLSSNDKTLLTVYFASVKSSVDFISKKLSAQHVSSRTEWSLWQSIKCAAGVVGGAVIGGIAGTAVGTVTLPLIGTVSGAAVGFWGGALSGMGVAC